MTSYDFELRLACVHTGARPRRHHTSLRKAVVPTSSRELGYRSFVFVGLVGANLQGGLEGAGEWKY